MPLTKRAALLTNKVEQSKQTMILKDGIWSFTVCCSHCFVALCGCLFVRGFPRTCNSWATLECGVAILCFDALRACLFLTRRFPFNCLAFLSDILLRAAGNPESFTRSMHQMFGYLNFKKVFNLFRVLYNPRCVQDRQLPHILCFVVRIRLLVVDNDLRHPRFRAFLTAKREWMREMRVPCQTIPKRSHCSSWTWTLWKAPSHPTQSLTYIHHQEIKFIFLNLLGGLSGNRSSLGRALDCRALLGCTIDTLTHSLHTGLYSSSASGEESGPCHDVRDRGVIECSDTIWFVSRYGCCVFQLRIEFMRQCLHSRMWWPVCFVLLAHAIRCGRWEATNEKGSRRDRILAAWFPRTLGRTSHAFALLS